MGPAILARALGGRVPYAVKVHGSALEYTVKPDPERFLPFAREGLAGASGVLVGSHHTAESLWHALADRELAQRTRLGPPGVDVERFTPREPAVAAAGLQELATRLQASAEQRASAADATHSPATSTPRARHLSVWTSTRDRLVVFVGKLIVSKGVDLLLAAWPLVLAQVPRARLVVVGFGAYRDGFERLLRGAAGRRHRARRGDRACGPRARGAGHRSRTRWLTCSRSSTASRAAALEGYLRAASALATASC